MAVNSIVAVGKEVLKTLNLKELPDGVFFDEQAFGRVHIMDVNPSIFGVDEYVYSGRIHKGRCGFLCGKKLNQEAPVLTNWDHGFTLEGVAQQIFTVDKALICVNKDENRTFCYVNHYSRLKFIGDPMKEYQLYVRIYENAFGIENYRWVVIWAQDPIDYRKH
jgi:hypothetical protein